MQFQENKKIKKIPVFTEEELKELGEVMYNHKGNEIIERRFWKEIYEKRGLKYK